MEFLEAAGLKSGDVVANINTNEKMSVTKTGFFQAPDCMAFGVKLSDNNWYHYKELNKV